MADLPLRIGIDYRPALLSSAGIGRSVRELSRALAQVPDLEIHLFGHSLSPARHRDAACPGAHLHRMPIPGRSLPSLARIGLDASWLSGRPAVFHWTDYVHPAVNRTRIVLTIHDLAFVRDPSFHGPQSEWLRDRCRLAATRARRIVCPSQATADHVVAEFPDTAERITVVPFGSDHVTPPVGPPPLDQPYILAVGTIEPRKNHRCLLAAWRGMDRPRPRLVILGKRGWECEDIVADLEGAAAAEGVLWLQGLPDPEVYRWMAHATALAYPSLFEGFGFPPLEAMTLGTPVVAGDTDALREVLGGAAEFCDPGDPAAWTTALGALVADPNLRDARSRAGRERAATLTWAQAAAGYAQVYRMVLE